MDTVTLDGHDLDAVTFPTQNTKILVIRVQFFSHIVMECA